MSIRFTNQEIAYHSSCFRAAEHRSGFSVLLKGIQGKGRIPQVWKFLPARKNKNDFQILQIQEGSGLHTHQSFGIKCLAADIGLPSIAVLVADGNKCFFNYFTARLKGAADHPQLRKARNRWL